MSERVVCIVTAAGRGSRAGGGLPKQWRDLGGRPAVARAVDALRPYGPVWLAIHPDDRALAEAIPDLHLVEGGATRSASVRAALEAVAAAGGADLVLIHDGARPLLPAAVVEAVLAALRAGAPAAAPALPVTDALWRADGQAVTATASREGLLRAQTPQGFRFDAILAAHRAAGDAGADDDVALALAAGLPVTATPGAEANLKLTLPEDFARAEALLEARMDIRIGNGFDVHAFGAGDHVTLCGVRVAHPQGLVGHSDADVGLHALTDAVLGALAQGDIGRHFPPSDPQWKGAESGQFLSHAMALAEAAGYRIGNADVTLICEAPKIGPHAAAMAARVAGLLGVAVDRVSVKATTTERLGFAGRGEGIAALATATLVRG